MRREKTKSIFFLVTSWPSCKDWRSNHPQCRWKHWVAVARRDFLEAEKRATRAEAIAAWGAVMRIASLTMPCSSLRFAPTLDKAGEPSFLFYPNLKDSTDWCVVYFRDDRVVRTVLAPD